MAPPFHLNSRVCVGGESLLTVFLWFPLAKWPFPNPPRTVPSTGQKLSWEKLSRERKVRVQRAAHSLPSALAHEVQVAPGKSPWIPFHAFLGGDLISIKSSPGLTRESPPEVSWCMSWCKAALNILLPACPGTLQKMQQISTGEHYHRRATPSLGSGLPSAPSSWGSWVVPVVVPSLAAGSALMTVHPPLLVH